MSATGLPIVQDISKSILLSLEPLLLSRLALEIINTDTVELLPTFAQPDSLIYGLALAIKKEIETSDFSCCVYVESLCHTLVVHLLRHYANHKPKLREYQNGLAPYKLKKILCYINDHLNEKLELAQMAQELDMSQVCVVDIHGERIWNRCHRYLLSMIFV
ncbi:MAG: hypothetical protein ACFB2X_27085 [Rivularia sp. (in: cyanobacteria)]